MRPQRVPIGRILRPHGVRGELKVELLSDEATRFDSVGKVTVTRNGVDLGEFEVTGWRRLGRAIGLKLVGIDTPEAALPLRNALLEAPALPAESLPENTYFVYDLVGLHVVSESLEHLGEVVDVVQLPSGELLVVKAGETEHLVPLVQDFVKRVDLEEKLVTLHLVPGLLDL